MNCSLFYAKLYMMTVLKVELLLHLKGKVRDLPSGPVAKSLCFQCWGPRLDPWWGN